MKIGVIKYNAGNIQSVTYALERLGVNFIVTDNVEQLLSSDKIIFPGVGEASSTMNYLRSRNLDSVIKNFKQPVLGICLGMQLMCAHSEENNTECLGIFNAGVQKFIGTQASKVPHMGWNKITLTNGWLDEKLNQQLVYFVHSYFVPVNEYTSAITDYIVPFSASMKKDNYYAVQFHPEKSAAAGEMILNNFLAV